MNRRLLYLGLMAAVSQLFATGCLFHPVARWRANHPYGACAECHPRLHPIQSRRVVLGESIGPVVGPMVSSPPCHGCGGGVPGVPVTFSGAPGNLVPITHPPAGYPNISYPNIGYPMPLTPGPAVVPSSELPNPMPVPPNKGGN